MTDIFRIGIFLLGFVTVLGVVVVGRLWFVLSSIRRKRQRSTMDELSSVRPSSSSSNHQRRPYKTMIVLGSGGHTTEMLQLIKNLHPNSYNPVVMVVAETDTTSIRRVQAFQQPIPIIDVGTNENIDDDNNNNNNNNNTSSRIATTKIYRIPRSREVGQSYISSVGTTMYSFVFAFQMVWNERPDLLIVNGPGTCLPVAVSAFILRIMFGWMPSLSSSSCSYCRIVFIESFCRVTSLSLTGKLLYPIADLFLVCWEQLWERYPLTMLVTTFVPKSDKSTADASTATATTTMKKNKSE